MHVEFRVFRVYSTKFRRNLSLILYSILGLSEGKWRVVTMPLEIASATLSGSNKMVNYGRKVVIGAEN